MDAPSHRCGRQDENQNEIKCEIYKWWAREDSNLQPDRYERTCEGQWKRGLLSILRHFCFCLTRFGQ